MKNWKEESRSELMNLLNKESVRFTKRGNAAIKLALSLAKEKGFKKLLLPDQGGWMTFPQFGKKLGFEVIEFKTDDGYFTHKDIPKVEDAVLLINSMPAYAFVLDIAGISEYCKKNNLFFINDVSATVGSLEATFGDVCMGSCNHWKPLALDEGGFIAANNLLEIEEPDINYDALLKLITSLKERTIDIYHQANKLKQFLIKENVIHPNHRGFNVIVVFDSEVEKERLINLVKTFDDSIEYTLCPRYIRVLRNAISFEIKKKFTIGDIK